MRDVGSGVGGAISLTTRANNSCSILNSEMEASRIRLEPLEGSVVLWYLSENYTWSILWKSINQF